MSPDDCVYVCVCVCVRVYVCACVCVCQPVYADLNCYSGFLVYTMIVFDKIICNYDSFSDGPRSGALTARPTQRSTGNVSEYTPGMYSQKNAAEDRLLKTISIAKTTISCAANLSLKNWISGLSKCYVTVSLLFPHIHI